ncbi:MAG: MetQ/NlpA family ABC transporter substrate-binding protein [Sporomusaceae bacterium]|nr:MetQ/NlpA family ABC transporter substrate-binding protein [Sporomusaceae bacterium]
MNKKKVAMIGLMAILAIGILSGCGNSTDSKQVNNQNGTPTVKVGTTAGPGAEVLEQVKKEAAKQNLNVEIVEFNDYIQPNEALREKSLDMNAFQTKPFLDSESGLRGYKFSMIGKSIILPMGAYSKKIASIDDLKSGATIAIPNDVTQAGRALMLIEKSGVIKLKPGLGMKATVNDIAENPKNVKFIEVDAAQTPRSLEDVDLAAINTNYALNVGLNPKKDALILEDKNSPWGCYIVAREEDKDNPTFQQFVKIYDSEPIAKFIEERFQGSVFPTW